MSFSEVMVVTIKRRGPSPDTPMAKIAPYGLRLPPTLKDALDKAARANGRSLNSEIVARLESSLDREAAPMIAESERLAQIERAVTGLLGTMVDLSDRIERLGG